MVVIYWNVGVQVAHCTMCQPEAYIYSDFSCHNNSKHLYVGNCHLNQQSSDITRDSAKVLLV